MPSQPISQATTSVDVAASPDQVLRHITAHLKNGAVTQGLIQISPHIRQPQPNTFVQDILFGDDQLVFPVEFTIKRSATGGTHIDIVATCADMEYEFEDVLSALQQSFDAGSMNDWATALEDVIAGRGHQGPSDAEVS